MATRLVENSGCQEQRLIIQPMARLNALHLFHAGKIILSQLPSLRPAITTTLELLLLAALLPLLPERDEDLLFSVSHLKIPGKSSDWLSRVRSHPRVNDMTSEGCAGSSPHEERVRKQYISQSGGGKSVRGLAGQANLSIHVYSLTVPSPAPTFSVLYFF